MSTAIVDINGSEQSSAAKYLVETLGLVDPTVNAVAVAESKLEGTAAPRLSALVGARGVLLDNTKGNAGPLLRHVGDLLEQKYGVQSLRMARKLVYSRPADPALLDELARDYEFVVTGVGACGSCTSGCVRDAVDLEARGIPTVAIHTTVFMNSAIAHRGAFGRPDLQFVPVEHPIAAVSDAELERRAVALVDDVAAILIGDKA
ncbi:UGSC family (seleno)protein [Nocardia alni]|uniref:UGSC family (seleno)protein n=1 Tax=Nocardia alni TaxID=2815723 RepID=UPI001C21A1A6|nr:UGSC family (seleno)protein [Nocardia alni]